MIAAMILGNTGVPATTIAEDYALSGRYSFARYLAQKSASGVPPEVDTWQEYQSQFYPP